MFLNFLPRGNCQSTPMLLFGSSSTGKPTSTRSFEGHHFCYGIWLAAFVGRRPGSWGFGSSRAWGKKQVIYVWWRARICVVAIFLEPSSSCIFWESYFCSRNMCFVGNLMVACSSFYRFQVLEPAYLSKSWGISWTGRTFLWWSFHIFLAELHVFLAEPSLLAAKERSYVPGLLTNEC